MILSLFDKIDGLAHWIDRRVFVLGEESPRAFIHDRIDKFLCWLDWRFLFCADDIPHDIMVCWDRIKRIFDYVPILWHDFDFNGDIGMFKLMKKKLERLEPELVHFVSAERSRKRIRICITLLDRIINDTYEIDFHDKHEKKWGEIKMRSEPCKDSPGYSQLFLDRKNVRTPEDEKKAGRELLKGVKLAYQKKQRDINYVFNTLSKHLQSWWD